MDIVVFDTETNGLNINDCDMLSIGWIKIRKYNHGNRIMIVERSEYFIKNDDIHNNPECFVINGISDEFRNMYGVPVDIAIDRFMYSINNAYVYAYNVGFDVGFVTKYKPDAFVHAALVDEIRINETDSVLNSIQRVVNIYYPNFDHYVAVSEHLHSAFDDAWAEMIILLHDKLAFNVRSLLIKTDFYEPRFGTGKYKNVLVDEVIRNNIDFVRWFIMFKESPFEDYLRDYILNNYSINGLTNNNYGRQRFSNYWMNKIKAK